MVESDAIYRKQICCNRAKNSCTFRAQNPRVFSYFSEHCQPEMQSVAFCISEIARKHSFASCSTTVSNFSKRFCELPRGDRYARFGPNRASELPTVQELSRLQGVKLLSNAYFDQFHHCSSVSLCLGVTKFRYRTLLKKSWGGKCSRTSHTGPSWSPLHSWTCDNFAKLAAIFFF